MTGVVHRKARTLRWGCWQIAGRSADQKLWYRMIHEGNGLLITEGACARRWCGSFPPHYLRPDPTWLPSQVEHCDYSRLLLGLQSSFNSRIVRNTASPPSILAMRFARTSPCQAGDCTESGVRASEAHSNSIA